MLHPRAEVAVHQLAASDVDPGACSARQKAVRPRHGLPRVLLGPEGAGSGAGPERMGGGGQQAFLTTATQQVPARAWGPAGRAASLGLPRCVGWALSFIGRGSYGGMLKGCPKLPLQPHGNSLARPRVREHSALPQGHFPNTRVTDNDGELARGGRAGALPGPVRWAKTASPGPRQCCSP